MSKLTRGQGSTSFSHELGDAFQIFYCLMERLVRVGRVPDVVVRLFAKRPPPVWK